MAEAPRQNARVISGWRLRCCTCVAMRMAGAPTARAGGPTAAAGRRAGLVSRGVDIARRGEGETSWARELAQARIMPATEARRVRKTAVVTVVKRKVSAVDTSAPNAAWEP